MDVEKGKFQYAGLKFLYEMELIDEPQLINNLKMNIFDISSSIKDIEFLSSYHHRQMLIYIEVSWFGRKFLMKRIEDGILERVKQLLPNFRFRVTSDRKILDLALKTVQSVLKGEQNESSNHANVNDTVSTEQNASNRIDSSEDSGKSGLQEESSILQNTETKTGNK